MKTLTFFLFLILGSLAHAQFTRGDTIKATTTVHTDGSRSTLVVNPETQSAEETYFDGAGKVTQKIIYPLDPQNQPIGAITYDRKGNILAKSSYKRDEAGRIGEETITSAAGQFLRRRVYSYSAQNKVSRVDEYDANGVLIAPPPRAAKAVPKKR
ncbi:MAG: hypothetical protein QOE70_4585 [Chthoniobacter sp.]|nr:hypothetical protein [Chthoniobacter sp.]